MVQGWQDAFVNKVLLKIQPHSFLLLVGFAPDLRLRLAPNV